jgi:hypothetical protein
MTWHDSYIPANSETLSSCPSSNGQAIPPSSGLSHQSVAEVGMSSPDTDRTKLLATAIIHSFAIFVYLVPIVSETRQTQIIVKSPEEGTRTVAVGETHGNVISCLSKSTLKGSNSIRGKAHNWLDRELLARGFAPTATIVLLRREKAPTETTVSRNPRCNHRRIAKL